MTVRETMWINTMSLHEEVKSALIRCSVHDADSFVVVSFSSEVRKLFAIHIGPVSRWNVISEIERQIGGFYVYEKTSSDGFIWGLVFRKHLSLLSPEDK